MVFGFEYLVIVCQCDRVGVWVFDFSQMGQIKHDFVMNSPIFFTLIEIGGAPLARVALGCNRSYLFFRFFMNFPLELITSVHERIMASIRTRKI